MAIVNVRYMVDDVAASVDFYTRHFGFAVDSNAAPAFAAVTRGDLRLLLSGETSSAAPPRPASVCGRFRFPVACGIRVLSVAPGEPGSRVVDGPCRPIETERELREAHPDVGVGIFGEEAFEVVRLDADAPFDCSRIATDSRAPAHEGLHFPLELDRPLRKAGVPAVGVFCNEAEGSPLT